MADCKLSMTGFDKLLSALDTAQDLTDVRRKIQYHTANMAKYASLDVPVKTGFLRRSEVESLEEAGMTGRVSFYADYGPYQEYGTRWIYGKFFLKKGFDRASKEFIIDLERMFG